MKRPVGASLILLFLLGPLVVLLQADDESRLPACCRRHGMHHCAMAGMMAQARVVQPGELPRAAAPMHCPFYPGGSGASTIPVLALVEPATGVAVLPAHPQSPASARAAARQTRLRTRTTRGPPQNLLA